MTSVASRQEHDSGDYSDSSHQEIDPDVSGNDGGQQESDYESAGSDSERSGDPDAQEAERRVDDDEDRSNPQYIPKRGTFYEHDDRTAASGEELNNTASETTAERKEGSETPSERRRPPRKSDTNKWSHDKYNENEQAPKSRDELVAIYGYDIRNEDAPPHARRNRRYGRGPNKYTRTWEDEEAYKRQAAAAPAPRKPPTAEDFPELDSRNNKKRIPRPRSKSQPSSNESIENGTPLRRNASTKKATPRQAVVRMGRQNDRGSVKEKLPEIENLSITATIVKNSQGTQVQRKANVTVAQQRPVPTEQAKKKPPPLMPTEFFSSYQKPEPTEPALKKPPLIQPVFAPCYVKTSLFCQQRPIPTEEAIKKPVPFTQPKLFSSYEKPSLVSDQKPEHTEPALKKPPLIQPVFAPCCVKTSLFCQQRPIPTEEAIKKPVPLMQPEFFSSYEGTSLVSDQKPEPTEPALKKPSLMQPEYFSSYEETSLDSDENPEPTEPALKKPPLIQPVFAPCCVKTSLFCQQRPIPTEEAIKKPLEFQQSPIQNNAAPNKSPPQQQQPAPPQKQQSNQQQQQPAAGPESRGSKRYSSLRQRPLDTYCPPQNQQQQQMPQQQQQLPPQQQQQQLSQQQQSQQQQQQAQQLRYHAEFQSGPNQGPTQQQGPAPQIHPQQMMQQMHRNVAVSQPSHGPSPPHQIPQQMPPHSQQVRIGILEQQQLVQHQHHSMHNIQQQHIGQLQQAQGYAPPAMMPAQYMQQPQASGAVFGAAPMYAQPPAPYPHQMYTPHHNYAPAGGVTYFTCAEQEQPRTQRRPTAAIPIVRPQANERPANSSEKDNIDRIVENMFVRKPWPSTHGAESKETKSDARNSQEPPSKESSQPNSLTSSSISTDSKPSEPKDEVKDVKEVKEVREVIEVREVKEEERDTKESEATEVVTTQESIATEA